VHSNFDDKELVRKSLGGDSGAFAAIVERYQHRVYNIAFRMTGDREDSLDLAQESFIRVFRALHGFKGDSSLSTWIYRIANNVVVDELRKRQRRPKVVQSTDAVLSHEDGEHTFELSSPLEDTPEQVVLRKEKRQEIQLALLQLSAEHRAVLVMRDVEGLSYEEIAEIFMLNVGTVKSRLNRARLALREKLAKAEHRERLGRLNEQKGGRERGLQLD